MDRFGHQTVKARKPHLCANCAASIPVGTLYLRQCVADAGMLQTVKAHPRCAQLSGEIGYDADEAYDWEDFRQDCYMYGGPGPFPWEPRFYAVNHAE